MSLTHDLHIVVPADEREPFTVSAPGAPTMRLHSMEELLAYVALYTEVRS